MAGRVRRAGNGRVMSTDDFVRFLAPLVFRAADKFFKFISWAIIVVALRYADAATGSAALHVLNWIATLIFGSALLLQAFYLFLRDPDTLGVPAEWHRLSRVIQIVAGFGLAVLLASPAFFLDQALNALAQARPR